MKKPVRISPGAGQESVWDYPRPPRLDQTNKHVQVIFNGVVLADSKKTIRILETSHPPVYYIPVQDVQMDYLVPENQQTFCEFKGAASYYSIRVGEKLVNNAAWSYPNPSREFEAIRGYLAFYPALMDRCLVDDEVVVPQPGGFYGGWITKDIVGPFKGEPGTFGW
ncbi:MAG: hypothetical protein C0410_15920 [Anaerolinea sp.]|nr:hypothetical protein [Anaerolinea sp.]